MKKYNLVRTETTLELQNIEFNLIAQYRIIKLNIIITVSNQISGNLM